VERSDIRRLPATAETKMMGIAGAPPILRACPTKISKTTPCKVEIASVFYFGVTE
jgi:hypothetical protein